MRTAHDTDAYIAGILQPKARKALRADGFTGKASKYEYYRLQDCVRDVAWDYCNTPMARSRWDLQDDDEVLELADNVTFELLELIDGTVI